MSVKDRMIYFIAYLDQGGQNWFEEKVGLSRGFVNKIGDSIRKKSMDKIRTHYPELNPSWLLTGEGEMLLSEDNTDGPKAPYKAQRRKEKKGLPVYESHPATLSNVESYNDEPQGKPDFYVNIPQYRNCDFITRARGDSMHPIIRNMALVGGKRIYDFKVIVFGDIYIIHTRNGIETVKYIHPHETDDDQILLVPYNGNAKTTPVHKSEILRVFQAQFVLNPL